MKGHIRKRGSTWSYIFDLGTVDGKRKQKEKGGFRTKKLAESAMHEAMTEWENRGIIVEPSSISYADFLNYWYDNYVMINTKLNTQKAHKTVIEKRIKPILGNYKLKQLTPGVLQQFLNDLKNEYAKNYVSNIYGVLSCSLKYAVHPMQLLKENPMQYVSMPKYESKPQTKNDLKIISREDYARIIERYPFGSTFYIPCVIAWNTGLRVGEVCALQWSDIDLENATISVSKTLINDNGKWVRGTTKTKTSVRTIAIGATLINDLKRWTKYQKEMQLKYGKAYLKSDYVCVREDGNLVTTDTIKVLSRVVNKKLGICFNFHSFRHTHATMLIEAGVPMKVIQERLGHSNMATTADTYSHITKNIEQSAIDKFESLMNG